MFARLIEGEWQEFSLADLIEENGGPANFSAPDPFDEAAAANHGMAQIANGERPAETLTRTPVYAGLVDAEGVPTRSWTLEPVELEQAKEAMWRAVKRQRTLLTESPGATVTTPAGVVQSDARSQANINGLVTMAILSQMTGQPFSAAFTLADNTVVNLNATQMIGLGVAVGRNVQTVYARATELREEIDAAADVAALEAIDIEEGWP